MAIISAKLEKQKFFLSENNYSQNNIVYIRRSDTPAPPALCPGERSLSNVPYVALNKFRRFV